MELKSVVRLNNTIWMTYRLIHLPSTLMFFLATGNGSSKGELTVRALARVVAGGGGRGGGEESS